MRKKGQPLPGSADECREEIDRLNAEIGDCHRRLRAAKPRRDTVRAQLRKLLTRQGGVSRTPPEAAQHFAELCLNWREPSACLRRLGNLEEMLERLGGDETAACFFNGDMLTVFTPATPLDFDFGTSEVCLGTVLHRSSCREQEHEDCNRHSGRLTLALDTLGDLLSGSCSPQIRQTYARGPYTRYGYAFLLFGLSLAEDAEERNIRQILRVLNVRGSFEREWAREYLDSDLNLIMRCFREFRATTA